jgi:predicted DNA-binding protein (MmcQ/YjbR family)
VGNLDRLDSIATRLPEVARVDIEAWGGEPTFRVAGKNFIFAGADGRTITLKLTLDEAAAVVATDPEVVPAGYGLGRSGWVSIALTSRPSAARWREVEEWIRTSYTLVAPTRLARQVLDQDRTNS